MREIMRRLREQALAGEDCFLIALIETEGSTPRDSGAYMLVNRQGYVCGTVGGGGMEYMAMLEAKQDLLEGRLCSRRKLFDLTPAAGMACGGYVSLELCYFAANARTVELTERVLSCFKEQRPFWVLLPLGEGELRLERELSLAGRRGLCELDGCSYYAEQYCYDGMVYVFGAGHVARELVPLLCHLGFRCSVFDDREEFADAGVFPMAERVERVDFKRLESVCQPQERDYAVVMTRGHVHDANCERYLLRTPVGYLGVMGSRQKAALARELLLSEGYSEEQLARVVIPIGLSIGSETPAEIAVAIAAQLIEVRARRG